MYRKLPKTVEYLESLNKEEEYAVFDFKIHNILGHNSVSNQVPIFGPLSKFVFKFDGDQEVDYLGEDALWNLLKDHGFISMLGLENCDSYFPRSLGRRPEADYVGGPFYCMSYEYADYKMEKDAVMKQRCIGPHMSHWYLLKYAQQLTRMNQGVNQF